MNEHEGHDHDLRAKLTKALTECSGADIDEDVAAVWPVVRVALAVAWDDGWEARAAWWGRPPRDDFQPAPSNPWRQEQP